MSDSNWLGRAIDVKQTYTITVAGTWSALDTVTITIDGVDFVITIGSLITTAQVATTIKQAYNGDSFSDTTALATIAPADGGAIALGQFAEMVATVSASVVTLTAVSTVGKPFTITVADTSAGSATGAAATAAKGRHEADNADNFSAGAVLANNDALYFPDGSIDMLYDLSLGVQLASVHKSMQFTGNVGLPITNLDNSAAPYTEYRTPLYATTNNNSVTTTANLETGKGHGSKRFKWDFGAGQFTANIFGRGTRELTGVPCILLKGTHASNELNNLAGDVGVAFFPGETSTLLTVRNGDGPQSVAETVLGAGVTLTSATVNMNGGKLETNSAIAAVNQVGGTHSHKLGTITAHNCNGGTLAVLGAVTITTQTIGSKGTVDLRVGTGAVVFTNPIEMYPGAKFYDPQGRCAAPVFDLNGFGELKDIVLANGRRLTISAA